MTSTVTLTILDGSLAGKKIKYDRPRELVLGRDPECEHHGILFPPEAGLVSAKHCNIIIQPPTVRIQDLNSSNGTYLNDVLIGSKQQPNAAAQEISANGIVKIGDIRIQIEVFRDPAAPLPVQPTEILKPSPQRVQPPPAAAVPAAAAAPVNTPANNAAPEKRPLPATVQENLSRAGAIAARAIDAVSGKLRNLAENETIEQVVPWIKIFNNSKELPAAIQGHRIISTLGQGKYGEVYLAVNKHGHKVALKRMLEKVSANSEVRNRFNQEIENLRLLDHRNIAKWLDTDIYDNNHFYVMEYCELGSLNGLIEYMGGRLPIDIAKIIILQVLDGLIYIHEEAPLLITTTSGTKNSNQLVHRDLKPGNILLTNDGLNLVAKISDFGLSKALGVEAAKVQTAQNTTLGTYQFMCRRQAQNFKNAEPAGDVWAAAACLYYMLTGEYPRDFSKYVLPDMVIANEAAVPILNRNPQIYPQLAAAIDLALAEDAEQGHRTHFQTAAAFKEALLSAFP